MSNIKYRIGSIDSDKNLIPGLISIPKKIKKIPRAIILR